jgi:hypothetical protein
MTTEIQNNAPEEKPNDKEYNFRQLEAKFQKKLEEERQAREELERRYQEQMVRAKPQDEEEDASDEPYVDHKKLSKKLEKFDAKTREYTKTEIQKGIQQALAEERKNMWIKQNPDFYDTMQHADKLASANPDLAETILQMPDGFERQKLVYNNIKALGLHKPQDKKTSVQDAINANQKNPYYTPSGVSSPAYSQTADFSDVGRKNAYNKMLELKKRLRLG